MATPEEELLERVFLTEEKLTRRSMEAIVTKECASIDNPFGYLKDCYDRALKEKVLVSHNELNLILNLAMELAVSLGRIFVKAKYLLPLVPTSSEEGGFVDLFLTGCNDDDPHVRGAYSQLKGKVSTMSVLGDFDLPLDILRKLMKYQSCRAILVNHPQWLPKPSSPKSELDGRSIERKSILGAFVHVSAIPDIVWPTVPDCLDFVRKIVPGDDVPIETLKTKANILHEGLTEVFKCLNVKDVMEYLAEAINRNTSREGVIPTSCASIGMFVNLSVVMLRLCATFLSHVEFGKIDHRYVFYNQHLELRGLTALNASPQEVLEWFPLMPSQEASSSSSGAGEPSKFPLQCEWFFMTARVLNLGLIKGISHVEDLDGEIDRATLESTRHSYQLEKSCYEVSLKVDASIYDAMLYYHVMVQWLCRLVGGLNMPLLLSCPKNFACIPEHFVEDTMVLLKYHFYMALSLDDQIQVDYMEFIIVFMARPEYIKKPCLRHKMFEVLRQWFNFKMMDPTRGTDDFKSLCKSSKIIHSYLVKNLLMFYIDFESQTTELDLDVRSMTLKDVVNMLQILWKVPHHQKVWREIAKVKTLYLNFWKSLVRTNKARLVSIGSMTKEIIKIRMKDANEDMRLLTLTSELLLPEMTSMVSTMLGSYLTLLVERQIGGDDKFIKRLLEQIVNVYVNLAKGDRDYYFREAITLDDSYKLQLFDTTAELLRKIKVDSRITREFDDLRAKAKQIAEVVVPDKFLDSLVAKIMEDPVILPSSKIRVDRETILRHLQDTAQNDPFTRVPLTEDMLICDLELKTEIQEFRLQRRQKLKDNERLD